MATVADVAMETRENIPLKKGKKTPDWCGCANEDYLSGSKFIIIAFGTLTVVITIALLLQIYYGDYQVVPHGSVATDSFECSKIGTSILKSGGNSIDATIASAFCLSVVTPHLTSLDAGGQLLIYNHRKRLFPDVIDFSGNNLGLSHLPRFVLGLAYVHQQFGGLSWKALVQPAVDIARKGFLITKTLVQAINKASAEDLYGRLEPGQILQLETLGATLENISNIPEEDLYSYVAEETGPSFSQAIKFTFKNYDVYVPGPPSIGPLLLFNLQQLEKHNFSVSDTVKPEYTYRLAEVTQKVYNDFNVTSKYDEGTSSNIAVIDLNDNYVSFTTGLSSIFGSGEMTAAGYTLDSRIKDKGNSRLPLMVTDGSAICGRRLVLGANDMATASQIIMSLLIAKENVTDAIEAPRFHILNNGSIGIEGSHTPLFSEDVLQYLETLTASPLLEPEPYFSSNIVEKVKDDLNSHSDSRGGGIASRF